MIFNQVNEKRFLTDTYFLDESGDLHMQGMLDKAIRYIERYQLLDPVHWRRFVTQFREQPDSENSGWRGECWGKMTEPQKR